MVDKKSFRALLKYQRSQTTESDIPHRKKLREEILAKAEEVKADVRGARYSSKLDLLLVPDGNIECSWSNLNHL